MHWSFGLLMLVEMINFMENMFKLIGPCLVLRNLFNSSRYTGVQYAEGFRIRVLSVTQQSLVKVL